MTRATKPTATDKLVAWKGAYDMVLEELLRDLTARDAAVLALVRVGAARTAALLIGGTDLGNSDSRNR